MVQPGEAGGGRDDTTRLPKREDDENQRILSDSKLGKAEPGDLAGASESQALSQSKLGSSDDGGRKGQGGMRDPAKTSDADRLKPS